jgi:hypothetical protein
LLLTYDINKHKALASVNLISAGWSLSWEEFSLILKYTSEIILRSDKKVSVKALVSILNPIFQSCSIDDLIVCIAVSLNVMDVEVISERNVMYISLRNDVRKKPDIIKEYRILKDYFLSSESKTAIKTVEMNLRYLSSLKKMLDIVHSVQLINKSGRALTKDEVKNKYSLSERAYKRFIYLHSMVSTSLRLKVSGMKIPSISAVRAVIRKDVQSYKLSDDNKDKIRMYSQIFNESDENTINRVLRDFFCIHEQTKRLRKKRG